jgi:hypothetical protein
MNLNKINMQRLTIFSLVFFTILVSSCKKDTNTSTVTPFLSDYVEVDPFTDQGYLKVVDGANIYYFNGVIPDTIGFAVDEINKFVAKDGSIVDTLWLTKDYAEFGDTTSDGFKVVNVPIEKYNRGHNSTPMTFNYHVVHTISNGGSLDLEGTYHRISPSGTVDIFKVSAGNFVMETVFIPSRFQPGAVFVDASNTITIPDTYSGYYAGSFGALTIRQAMFFKIRYAQVGGSPGVGDTLLYSYKRTDVNAPVNVKLVRQ